MVCKKNTRYMQEDLQFAVREVEGGNSLSAAAAEFGIPKATLHGHTSGLCKHVGSGAPTVLQLQDEQEIVLTCQVLAEMGFGITRRLVKTIINNYIRENNIPTPFCDGKPGKGWWQRFMKRWPSLTQRKPQHLSKSRAQAANNMVLMAFFDSLEKSYNESGLNMEDPTVAHRIWNCDETAFCTSAISGKLLCTRSVKSLHEVGGGSHNSTRVL